MGLANLEVGPTMELAFKVGKLKERIADLERQLEEANTAMERKNKIIANQSERITEEQEKAATARVEALKEVRRGIEESRFAYMARGVLDRLIAQAESGGDEEEDGG